MKFVQRYALLTLSLVSYVTSYVIYVTLQLTRQWVSKAKIYIWSTSTTKQCV